MSDIQVINHNLAPVQYQDYLEAIKQTLDRLAKSKDKNDRYLYVTEKSISFDIDKIAEKVSRIASSPLLPNSLDNRSPAFPILWETTTRSKKSACMYNHRSRHLPPG